MINIAIIGTGGYAFEQIKRVCSMPEYYRVIAAAPSIEEPTPGVDFCQERDIPVLADVEEVLSRFGSECDMVLVPTPIHTHFGITSRCLRAGKQVLLEKPPVATIQEHLELVRISQECGISVPVCFQHLYGDTVKYIKSLICAGQLGRIRRIRCLSLWSRDEEYYQRAEWAGKLRHEERWVLDGTINNPIAHSLMNCLYFACDTPERLAEPLCVQAELYRGHNIETEDTSSVRVFTRQGVEIVVNSTLCAESAVVLNLVVEGEKGTVRMSDLDRAEVEIDGGGRSLAVDSRESRDSMLLDFSQQYQSNRDYLTCLEFCVPFTLVVNGAFESAERIVSVPSEHVIRFLENGSVRTNIVGVNAMMKQAHEEGKLLSEGIAPWAQSSRRFSISDRYRHFPVTFRADRSVPAGERSRVEFLESAPASARKRKV